MKRFRKTSSYGYLSRAITIKLLAAGGSESRMVAKVVHDVHSSRMDSRYVFHQDPSVPRNQRVRPVKKLNDMRNYGRNVDASSPRSRLRASPSERLVPGMP